jgi:hypothetical protein
MRFFVACYSRPDYSSTIQVRRGDFHLDGAENETHYHDLPEQNRMPAQTRSPPCFATVRTSLTLSIA